MWVQPGCQSGGFLAVRDGGPFVQSCRLTSVAGAALADDRGLGQAIRTAPPVGDLGLVDLVALVVDRRETGRRADRAVDVDQTAADAADQMVVVVADAILEASR